jgi:hypothetical protein
MWNVCVFRGGYRLEIFNRKGLHGVITLAEKMVQRYLQPTYFEAYQLIKLLHGDISASPPTPRCFLSDFGGGNWQPAEDSTHLAKIA